MPTRLLPTSQPIDLPRTLGPVQRGPGDPTFRRAGAELWRATRTPDGPATMRLLSRSSEIEVESWGPGADWILEHAPAIVGADDDWSGFEPSLPLLRNLRRRFPGMRLSRTGAVMEALMPAVLEQKVTGTEAWRAWRGIVRAYSEPAPGDVGLLLPPAAAVLAALPYYALHPLGVERRRAETLRRACAQAVELERIVDLDHEAARARLMTIPGIGPWTAAEVAVRALGDPDAVSVGDFHLPNLVSFALAGEPRGDDARMLELLEPYRGHRARVIRLLEVSGLQAPRYGPRYAPRSIAGM